MKGLFGFFDLDDRYEQLGKSGDRQEMLLQIVSFRGVTLINFKSH